jgi:hypothetical protein
MSDESRLFRELELIDRGSAFVEVWTVTSKTSDPNTWTLIRFSIVGPDGTKYTLTSNDPTPITKAVTGTTAPWQVTISVPIGKSYTLSLPTGECRFQLDYVGADDSDQDVIAAGRVCVVTPDVDLP